MNDAIAASKNWKNSNTEVRQDGDVSKVFLHGTLIAEVAEGWVKVGLSGWNTSTTRSRLNAVLTANGIGGGFVQRNHEPFFAYPDGTKQQISAYDVILLQDGVLYGEVL